MFFTFLNTFRDTYNDVYVDVTTIITKPYVDVIISAKHETIISRKMEEVTIIYLDPE